jgi:hypothetical protein
MPLDPLYQLDIAEIAFTAPACWRVRGWGVVNPYPARRPNRSSLVELFLEAPPRQRPVPPWAYREERVVDDDIVAVAGDADFSYLADPARDFFALCVAFVEVVIAGAEDDACQACEPHQVLLDDDDLSAEVDSGRDVECVSGKDYQVELRGCAEQPIELGKRVVQIRDD